MREKEPFNYAEFARMYPNSNGIRRLNPNNEGDCRFYTDLYYATDSVFTVDEFVKYMDYLDDFGE